MTARKVVAAQPRPSSENAPAPLAKVLGELLARNVTLNDLDSRLSEEIGRVEDGLRAHFSVRLERSLDDDAGTVLAFGKHEGKWQLLVETASGQWSTVTSLMSSSRETRARVFSDGHVEALIRDAVAHLDNQIVARNVAIMNASSVADAFDALAQSSDDDLPF